MAQCAVANQKCRSVLVNEKVYKEVMDSAAAYNAQLCIDRRLRLPFLDSQTGVAQNHSNLWIPYRYRGQGQAHGQLYTYPARRWRKKCNLPLPDLMLSPMKPIEMDINETVETHSVNAVVAEVAPPVGGIASVIAATTDADSNDVNFDESTTGTYREEFYGEWERLSEPLDAGEIDRRNSDSSDYEETYVKTKKKKKETKKKSIGGKEGAVGGKSSAGEGVSSGRGGRKKEKEVEIPPDLDKPYACDSCGMHYKTRPGLTYHLNHTHNKQLPVSDELDPHLPSPKSESPPEVPSKASKEVKAGSRYCDFCLGDEMENKKTGSKEEMVSCADCGRSGHPSCLQFTVNMIVSVKKYPWQCIECKSCGLCGTSDNDDQLLFCDDCDRGYHMYCLKPPLSEPPEGSWSCHLCIVEFYGNSKPPSSSDA